MKTPQHNDDYSCASITSYIKTISTALLLAILPAGNTFAQDTIPLTEEAITIKAQNTAPFEFTVKNTGTYYYISLRARIIFKIVSGSNPALQFLINDTLLTGSRLMNKPDYYISKRMPSGVPQFRNDAFQLFMTPDFEDVPIDNIYRPLDYDNAQIYTIVLNITDLVKKGNNTLILKNRMTATPKLAFDIVADSIKIINQSSEMPRFSSAQSESAPAKISEFKLPFSTNVQDTSFIDDHIDRLNKSSHGYEWLTAFQVSILEACRYWMEKSPEYVWYSVPSQKIPRSQFVNREAGSPVSGTKINGPGGYYQWKYDPQKHPWKLIDPVSQDIFPKNDFFTFYVSGFDKHGNFDPELGDKGLLYNTECKDSADKKFTFAVDPGTGFFYGGNKYNFIAFYAMHVLWGASQGFPGRPWAINSGPLYLAHAYEFTGDIRFARMALILLDRIADLYPEYDFGYWAKQGGYHQYGTALGKEMDHIWSCITVTKIARAYLMVRDAIDKDPELIKFTSMQAKKFSLFNKKDSPAAIKAHFDHNFIKSAFYGLRMRIIIGNQGFPEEAALRLSLAASDPALSREILKWLFSPFTDGYKVLPFPLGKERDGGGLGEMIVRDMTSDGFSREGGGGYITILPVSLMNMYEIISGSSLMGQFPSYKPAFAMLREKLKHYYRNSVHFTVIGKFIPNFGDGGILATPYELKGTSASELLRAFYILKDEELGRMFITRNNITDPLSLKQIFTNSELMPANQDPGKFVKLSTVEDLSAVLEKLIPLPKHSERTIIMPERGFAFLKSGKNDYRRALAMNFGDNTGHNHKDTLNLDLFAFGMSITPNFGYPSIPEVYLRREWWGNTLSKWTVAFTKTEPRDITLAQPELFSESPVASVLQVNGKRVFPELKRYDRTSAVIHVNEKQFYVVDFFRVDGADDDAMYCFHSSIGSASAEGVVLKKQSSGTLAGTDVKYAEKGFNGLSYVYDVSSADVRGAASLVWNLSDFRKISPFGDTIRTRLRIFHPKFELALGKGKTVHTQKDPPEFNHFAFAISSMASPLFSAVVECYEENKNPVQKVTELKRLSGSKYAGAIEVTLTDGTRDIILCTGDTAAQAVFAGGFSIKGNFVVIRLHPKGGYSLHAAAASQISFNEVTLTLKAQEEVKLSQIEDMVTDSPSLTLAQPITVPENVIIPMYLKASKVSRPWSSDFFEIDGRPETAGILRLSRTFLHADISGKDGKIEFVNSLSRGTTAVIPYSYYIKK